jgi:Domain of unknown function (DUF4282)/Protein of unknown function (DUF2510)
VSATNGQGETWGFFRSLYDFKFASLVATRWMKFIYAIWVVLLSLAAAIGVIASLVELSQSPVAGVVLLIAVLIYYVVWLIIIRVVAEVLIVFFRIGDDLRALRLGTAAAADSRSMTVPAATPLTVASTAPGAIPAAGWYAAPGDPARLRYWDGSAWTDHYHQRGTS